MSFASPNNVGSFSTSTEPKKLTPEQEAIKKKVEEQTKKILESFNGKGAKSLADVAKEAEKLNTKDNTTTQKAPTPAPKASTTTPPKVGPLLFSKLG